MTFSFNSDESAALSSGTYRIGVFFQMDTDPVIRLWLGHGKIEPGVNVYDGAGATYTGFGELQEIPVVRQLLNGTAERVEFRLSGVSGDVLAIASTDAEAVKNKRTLVGFALMGNDWQLIGPVHWLAKYTSDFISIEQQAADIDQPIVRTITLSCSTRFTGRRRAPFAYYTDQDQQARYPGDESCEYVSNYAHGFTKLWPVFP